ncbi:MAG: pilus assembly protein TadG-related protein [bacterium]|nr:pilus assembly protein TadG-related protein [bacterium]
MCASRPHRTLRSHPPQALHSRTRSTEPGENGSISMFVVVMVMALLVAIGLVVDGGRKIRAIETAESIAAHSALVAANELDFSANLLTGARPEIDVPAAVAAGNSEIAASGGVATPGIVVSGYEVCSTVSVTLPTTFLSIIGISSVTGVGEVCNVEPVPGLDAEIP